MEEEIHFEQIWNSCEETGSRLQDISTDNIISSIKTQLDKFNKDGILDRDRAIIVGEILFDICRLTYKHNINSAAALLYAEAARKIILMK